MSTGSGLRMTSAHTAAAADPDAGAANASALLTQPLVSPSSRCLPVLSRPKLQLLAPCAVAAAFVLEVHSCKFRYRL